MSVLALLGRDIHCDRLDSFLFRPHPSFLYLSPGFTFVAGCGALVRKWRDSTITRAGVRLQIFPLERPSIMQCSPHCQCGPFRLLTAFLYFFLFIAVPILIIDGYLNDGLSRECRPSCPSLSRLSIPIGVRELQFTGRSVIDVNGVNEGKERWKGMKLSVKKPIPIRN